tara:strand:- start:673 stop:1767 length:1095 start_codon:yes stop_codon:yes gene_type:complete
MANYLTLTNNVLNELNEIELTSSTFGSSRGVQTMVKNVINKAINDIYNSEVEWPFLVSSKTENLIAGTQEYDLPSDFRKVDWDSFMLRPKNLITNSTFSVNLSDWSTVSGSPIRTETTNAGVSIAGALRLNTAEVTQDIQTIINKQYVVRTRTFSNDVTLKIGTSSGGTQISTQTLSITNAGDGEWQTTEFTATATTTYIGFAESSGSNVEIDTVEVVENEQPTKLEFITHDEWFDNFSETDLDQTSKNQFAKPIYVYQTTDDKFGVSPIPDRVMSATFKYYQTHSDLSAYTDVPSLPTRFQDTVVNRAKYYAYMMRANVAGAQLAEKDYVEGVKRMRVELLNRKSYMYPKGLRGAGRLIGVNT